MIIDKNECFLELNPRMFECNKDHLLSPFVKLHDFFADCLLLRLVFFFVITSDFLGTLPEPPTVACPWSSLALARVELGRAEQSPSLERRSSPEWLGGEIDSDGESFWLPPANLSETQALGGIVVSGFLLLTVVLDRSLSGIKNWFPMMI